MCIQCQQHSMLTTFALPLWSVQSRQGSVNLPLLKIPIDHYVIDELHLFLRIFDVLMSNLISLALLMDRTAMDGSKQHLDGLTAAIRSCGVTFHTWKEQGREQLK